LSPCATHGLPEVSAFLHSHLINDYSPLHVSGGENVKMSDPVTSFFFKSTKTRRQMAIYPHRLATWIASFGQFTDQKIVPSFFRVKVRFFGQ
jgi:hypothetical protein